ncbi:hypothetical protein UPYG_G00176050 [Umbra pygmaea]|uniref:Bcl-2-like protein 15 n=1 Tax=Umbra pygmaea TaxID=75934 RepID=A0ABD0XAP6_UMBPY
MAPNVEQQTCEIISCFFDDLESTEVRTQGWPFETDGKDDGDDFDPVIIADKLREVADDLNEEFLKPHITIIQQAAADMVVEEFAHSVDSICKAFVTQKAEVAPEFQLLRASMALGMYVKKTCPEMKTAIQSAMTNFINSRLTHWITQQGGWKEVSTKL